MPRMTHKFDNKRHRQFGFLKVSAILLVLLLLVVPLALLISVSASQPLVVNSSSVGVDSAVSAKRIARQFYRGLRRPDGQHSNILLSERELNGIFALAARGIKGFKGRVELTDAGLRADVTLDASANPFGRYINVTATVAPSSDGLVVDHLAIGSLPISGRWLLWLTEMVLNRAMQDEQLGSELLAAIETVSVEGFNLKLVYHPVPDFRHKFAKLKKEVQFTRDDSELVKHYYQGLCRFHKVSELGNRVSLGAYLSYMFSDAQQRSLDSDEASAENEAALLALAIFLGSEKFNTVGGAVDEALLRACKPYGRHVLLANRKDLRLHFIFSAALQVISNSGISFSIGEYKELLDSRRGSSGFSFADLAADRAGIRFAELAIDESGARVIQKRAAQLAREAVFFPNISGLQEGLHQQEFEQLGGIESEYYKKHLAIIEARIDQLSLYQSP
ncbi:MAG: hypothetical protein V7745_05800 [Pseudomonadales bacterium]